MKRLLFPLVLLICGCSSDSGQSVNTELYFPPVASDVWETESVAEAGWNEAAVAPLLDYLEAKHSKSFIVLHNGRIVLENYFNGHSIDSNWYWASAGKTLTSTMTGIAQQESLLNLDDRVSDYLGSGWTSLTPEKENLITLRHLLTMTSGLEDIANGDCVAPECLTYVADAGTRWAYHNVYVKLQDVIAAASGETFSDYFNAKLRDKIGMNGVWLPMDNNIVYWSTSRSMARFGLLMLNRGNWNGETILNETYFNQATQTSQNINLSYGYLWWLDVKQSYHMPQTQLEFNGSIIPGAPSDMYMALGKNDQKIYVIPSRNIVIIRMGDAADNVNLALSDFDEQLWTRINTLIN
ncbi:MAG: class C beta-lactamase-related serine hydrolase [Flavobacterium sp.]|nr:MAG: class C beta-lactamase-related serine hydrolase [Flavobacterium sp.]